MINDLRALTEPFTTKSLSLIKDDPKVRREIENYLMELEEGIDDHRLIPFTANDFEVGVTDMPRRLATGYHGIEFETQRTNILEAYTSNGKSTFMINCAQNMCNGSMPQISGKPVLINGGKRLKGAIFSLEESALSIALKIARRTMNEKNGTAWTQKYFIELLQKDKQYLFECVTLLHDLFYRHLFLFGTNWTAEKFPMIVCKLIRQLWEDKIKLDFIWGDYIQRMRVKAAFSNRAEKLANVVDLLADVSRQHSIANIWNAQQNRPDSGAAKGAASEQYWLRLGRVTGAQEVEQNAAVVYAIVNRDLIKKQMGEGGGATSSDAQACVIGKLKDTNDGGVGEATELIWQPRIGSYYNAPRQTYQESVSQEDNE